jgi:hypothetical protein
LRSRAKPTTFLDTTRDRAPVGDALILQNYRSRGGIDRRVKPDRGSESDAPHGTRPSDGRRGATRERSDGRRKPLGVQTWSVPVPVTVTNQLTASASVATCPPTKPNQTRGRALLAASDRIRPRSRRENSPFPRRFPFVPSFASIRFVSGSRTPRLFCFVHTSRPGPSRSS